MTSRPTTRPNYPGRRGRPRFFSRRKSCSFCVGHIDHIDYKDVSTIRRFLTPRSKIESRRGTAVCSKHQRLLRIAIKRAQHLAMLPMSATHLNT